MTFGEAIEKLGINDYTDRIINSNSRGELFYCNDYIAIAQAFDELHWFREWFEQVVKWAEATWDRPESIFQHIPRMLLETIVIMEDLNETQE